MKSFLRSTYTIGIIALFLIVALLGVSQTDTFRSYVHAKLVEAVLASTGYALSLDRIEGNFFTRVKIRNVTIRDENEEILQADFIDFRFNPLPLLLRKVSFRNIQISNPVIFLTRHNNGSWNIDGFLKGPAPDTTKSTWTIDLKYVDLRDARIYLTDNLRLQQQKLPGAKSLPSDAINYAKVRLESVNLNISARIEPGNTWLRVSKCAFIALEPYFELLNLSGEASLKPRSVSLSNLKVETNNSLFAFTGRLGNILFSEIRDLSGFADATIDASLDAHHISFNEVRQFLPHELYFLDRTVGLRAKASGSFENLNINEFVLTTPRTYLQINGSIANLHEPKKTTLNLESSNSLIEPFDISDYLPGISIPDLSEFGKVSCNLRFVGTPLNFKASFEGTTERKGSFVIDANFDLRNNVPTYKGSIVTRDFDVSGILFDKNIGSNLHSQITFDGSGSNPNDMIAIVRAEIDSSVFYDLPINQSVIILNIAQGSARLRSTLRTERTELDLVGRLDFAETENPTFSLNAKVNSLNLAELLRDNTYDSDLYFDLTAAGSGLEFEKMEGHAQVQFLRSRFGREFFDPTEAKLVYRTADQSSNRFLDLETDAGQLTVKGSFTPKSFISSFVQGSKHLADAVQDRLAALDSLHSLSTPANGISVPASFIPTDGFDQLNADFDLSIVDLYPLGVILGNHLEGALRFSGNISGSNDRLFLQGNLDSPYFLLGPDGENLFMQSSTLGCNLRFQPNLSNLDSLEASFIFNSGRTHLGKLRFFDTDLSLNIDGLHSTYQFKTNIDSLLMLDLEGTSLFTPQRYVFTIPRLSLSTADISYKTKEAIDVQLGRNGFYTNSLIISNREESLSFSGLFSPNNYSDFKVSINNFSVENLRFFFSDKKLSQQFATTSGIVNSDSRFSGLFSNLAINADIHAEDLRVRETPVGDLRGTLGLHDGLMDVFLQLRTQREDSQENPDLLVSGTIPLKSEGVEQGTLTANRQMNLLVRSKEFNLEYIKPFVPLLSNLSGTISCDVTIGGTIDDPTYLGSISVQNSRFLFEPLNINYVVDGRLVPRGNRIALEDVTVKNIPQDRSDGSMNVTGTFSLEGLRIRDFNLTANGQLLIMKESAARSRQTLYGDLFGATGSSGIQWSGSPELSQVSGEVLIKNANLTLPPSRDSYVDRQRNIDFVFIDDTTSAEKRAEEEKQRDSIRFPRRSRSAEIMGPTLPEAAHSDLRKTGETPSGTYSAESSFLNNIIYNLAIETIGVSQLRIIVNQVTNEVLFADFKGRLFFNKEKDQTRLTGEVELSNRSFYNYIRQFQASGKLFFTGDPENPELDVIAKYEGYHQSSPAYGMLDSARAPIDDEKVTVSLEIKGTRREPKVTMGLVRETQSGDRIESSDVQADAISYLVSGKFRDELTPQERTSLFTTSLAGIGSSILSGPLTEIMRREFGFISSVDVLYYGGNIQGATDIRLTGEIGDAVIRFGGRVFSDIGNANVNIQLPMSSLLRSDRWRNFVFELERKAEGFEGIDQRREPTNGVRLLYRITF